MLTRTDLRGVADPAALVPRPDPAGDERRATVREIVEQVRTGGDAALRALTARLDGCDLDDLRVRPADVAAARERVAPDVLAALEHVAGVVRAYHEAQRPAASAFERDGVRVRELLLPVARAGCYVPGGRAAYPSTVLMTAVPARAAGVPEVVLCVPPDRTGRVADATLAAAAVAGVDEVYRVGGAQAIAALAHGTETIRPVDVVVGPGNVYVALAKAEVAGIVGTEAPAGPSELVVVADGTTGAEEAALDLCAQAEHGPGGTAVLVTWDPAFADAVDAAVAGLVGGTARRAEIAATLETGGRTYLVDGPEAAMAVANAVAPEHLELHVADPASLLGAVRNAGAVFLGAGTPAALGDYVAGPSHVLPTGRAARFASALRVDDFLRHVHVVEAGPDALGRVGPVVEVLAAAEGLDAHARSVARRRAGWPAGSPV